MKNLTNDMLKNAGYHIFSNPIVNNPHIQSVWENFWDEFWFFVPVISVSKKK